MQFDLTDPGLLLSAEVLGRPAAALRPASPRGAGVAGSRAGHLPGLGPGVGPQAVGPDDLSSNLVTLVRHDGQGHLEPYGLLPYGDPMHVLATADPPIPPGTAASSSSTSARRPWPH